MNAHSQHKTIESVLKRGENLDNLVDKSNDLSSASQVHISLCVLYTACKNSYLYVALLRVLELGMVNSEGARF